MPLYSYECPFCGSFDSFQPMSRYRDFVACPACRRPSPRDFCASIRTLQSGCFKPFTEENAPGGPIHFETRSERDTFLRAKGLTYERPRYSKPKPHQHAIDFRDETAHAMAEVKAGRRVEVLPAQPGEHEPET